MKTTNKRKSSLGKVATFLGVIETLAKVAETIPVIQVAGPAKLAETLAHAGRKGIEEREGKNDCARMTKDDVGTETKANGQGKGKERAGAPKARKGTPVGKGDGKQRKSSRLDG